MQVSGSVWVQAFNWPFSVQLPTTRRWVQGSAAGFTFLILKFLQLGALKLVGGEKESVVNMGTEEISTLSQVLIWFNSMIMPSLHSREGGYFRAYK